MTSAIPSGSVVEYAFRCFCGTPIVTTEKTVICARCGQGLGIRRVKRQHWKIAPPQVPHRRLRLDDLGELATRIAICLGAAACVYVLGQYFYDFLNG